MPEKIKKILSDCLSARLYEHCLRVADTAEKLAAGIGADLQKARTAGLLHDIARGMTGGELLSLASQNKIPVDDYSNNEPVLLHGPVGAAMAASLGFNDHEIREAIAYHTTGKADFCLIGRIVYLADKIEPGRDYPGVKELRRLAENDINEALICTVGQSIKYLAERKAIIHPSTISFWNWLIRTYVRK